MDSEKTGVDEKRSWKDEFIRLETVHREWIETFDAMPEPVFTHDRDYRIIRANRAYAEIAGMSIEEIIGMPYWRVFPLRDGPLAQCVHVIHDVVEEEVYLKNGDVFLSRGFPVMDENNSLRFAVHILENVTERKQTSRELENQKTFIEGVINTIPNFLYIYDIEKDKTIYANSRSEYMIGYAPNELVSMGSGILNQLVHKDDLLIFRRHIERIQLDRENRVYSAEYRMRHKDGNWVWVHDRSSVYKRDWNHEPTQILGSCVNITDHKRAEVDLVNLNRALKTLSACNNQLNHSMEEMDIMEGICRVIVEEGGYEVAWIGYYENDELEQKAFNERRSGLLDVLVDSWINFKDNGNSTHKTILTGKIKIDYDVLHRKELMNQDDIDPGRMPVACVSLPLKDNEQVFGVLNICASDLGVFNREELNLLENLSEDVSYGIVSLRARKERDEAIREREKGLLTLHRSLESAVESLASTVELRDPYTAGHQRRVAELARDIARELQMDEDMAYAIYLAGVVHDIGKIQIPSEILSKPSRLSDIEWQYIKTHSAAGHAILSGIDFPWPIADIVHQHHERLDGSGYPRGLHDDEILMESRILTVADVMEAISTHRPYRPALGVDYALNIIQDGRGNHYDTHVVDACINLFKYKQYTFSI